MAVCHIGLHKCRCVLFVGQLFEDEEYYIGTIAKGHSVGLFAFMFKHGVLR